MKKGNFESLVNKEKYQVFVFSSLAGFPINFARHTWIVVNKMGEISRYEVLHRKNFHSNNMGFMNTGYFYKNLFLPFQGIAVFFPLSNIFRWNARLEGICTDKDEVIRNMIGIIENTETQYPFVNTYHFLGPNSNTYTNWILKKFPEFKITLPYNAIGKNYRYSGEL